MRLTMKKKAQNVLLRYNKKYSINDYNNDCNQGKVEKLAEFIYGRFNERYIEPFEYMDRKYKNGFSIMAIACLMIETLENFWKGSNETPQGEGSEFFESFFYRCIQANNELSVFKDLNFYKNIRCGILHQGETKCGWKISRNGLLLNRDTQTINATKFLSRLKEYLIWYRNELKNSDFSTDQIWINFREKMKYIKKNCLAEGVDDC